MEWTVHPDIIKLLGWLVVILLAFINGILFEQNRQVDKLRKNKNTRLLNEMVRNKREDNKEVKVKLRELTVAMTSGYKAGTTDDANNVVFFDSRYKEADNGIEKKGRLEFSYITNYYTGRNLAALELKRSRYNRTFSNKTK